MAKRLGEEWERQHSETEKKYAAFKVFLDLGVNRTKLAAYRLRYNSPGAQHAQGWYAKWAKDWRWDERATAFDQHIQGVRTAALEKRVAKKVDTESIDWIERQDKLRETAYSLGVSLISTARKCQLKGEQLMAMEDGELTSRDAPAFIRAARMAADTGVKVSRLAADLATEIHEHKFTIDWGKLTTAEEERIANGESPHVVAPHAVEIN